MTHFWKTRGRTGRDFKHLLGCAAFLGQLAERKLHSLLGMVVSFWFIPLESLKVEFTFLKNLGEGIFQVVK